VFTSQSIDAYYGFCHGELPYRTIEMREKEFKKDWHQPVATVNFTSWNGPTRATEWKHLMYSNPNPDVTVVTYEYPKEYVRDRRDPWHTKHQDDGYYPIQTPENQALYEKYKVIPNPNTTFIGRCGTYQYLDMHQVINQSMQIAEKFMRSNEGQE
jgi:UDP-galactopyranose mutase